MAYLPVVLRMWRWCLNRLGGAPRCARRTARTNGMPHEMGGLPPACPPPACPPPHVTAGLMGSPVQGTWLCCHCGITQWYSFCRKPTSCVWRRACGPQAHNNAIFDVCWANGDTQIATASGDQSGRPVRLPARMRRRSPPAWLRVWLLSGLVRTTWRQTRQNVPGRATCQPARRDCFRPGYSICGPRCCFPLSRGTTDPSSPCG